MKIAKEDETLKDETLNDETPKDEIVKKHLVNTIFLYLLTLNLFHQLSKKHLASIVIIFV
jgi:hypothetical protein